MLSHGYGATGTVYFDLLALLSKHFHVYAFDCIGLGLSSREPYQYESAQASVDFFVRFIEAWRKALNLTNFYLVGHSLGGYLSTQYCRHYHAHVRKLVLLSPVGFTEKPRNFDYERMESLDLFDLDTNTKVEKVIPDSFNWVWPVIWHNDLSPWKTFRSFPQFLRL